MLVACRQAERPVPIQRMAPQYEGKYNQLTIFSLVKVFRIIPEFRILRLLFIESQPQNAELGSF